MVYSTMCSTFILIVGFLFFSIEVNGFAFNALEKLSPIHPLSDGGKLALRMAEREPDHDVSSPKMTRRDALKKASSVSIPLALATFSALPHSAHATQSDSDVHISASWSAVDGLNSLNEGKKFVSFDKSAYKAMKDDPARTPFFEKAIIKRLNSAPGGPSSQIVLDMGTGPFALFSIIAADAGAGKVYAIEANKDAARSARETIKKAGYEDKITVLEGFSTEISLPDNVKADFVVAEIIGSIATEEGAFATLLDAHSRLVRDPNNASSWIPSRIQTFAAPASYTLHNLFQPPAFDWTKLNGEPVRFNCRDQALQLLAEPVVVEDISFSNIRNEGSSGYLMSKKDIVFTVDGDRIEDNTSALYEELKRGQIGSKEAETVAEACGQSVSGIALWPRLVLDEDETIVVNSRRYPDGAHQRSHWQTVLPIMSPTPISVQQGSKIALSTNFKIPFNIIEPAKYNLEGDVKK